MPEFKLPTFKLRGFRDMTTDDIKSALSEVPRPDVKLADIADAAIQATQAAAKAATEAAAAAQSAAQSAAERARRSASSARAGRCSSSASSSPAWASWPWRTLDRIRPRLAEMSRRARERIDAERVSGSLERLGSDEEAYTGSVGIPIQADAYADTLPPAAPSEPSYGEVERVRRGRDRPERGEPRRGVSVPRLARTLHATTTPRSFGRGVVVRSADERRHRAGVACRAGRERRGHGPRRPRSARGRLDGPVPGAGACAGSAGVRGRGRRGRPGVRSGRSGGRAAGRQYRSGRRRRSS